MSPPPALPHVEDPEDAAFERLYGPWQAWTPARAADLLANWDATWWIAGGWAIDAHAATGRRHEDIDVAVFRRDVPWLRAHLEPAHHCWAAGSGMLAPLTSEQPQLPDWSDQLWIRAHSWSPWLVDFVATEDTDGAWTFRRDPTFSAPLDNVTWTGGDGVRYLRSEIALAWKAKLDRPKDHADLLAALPLLDPDARAWLRDMVRRLHPQHRWLALLT